MSETTTAPGVLVREATAEDLDALIVVYSDDMLAEGRERPDERERYARALAEVIESPNQTLYVAEIDGRVIGTTLITVIQLVSKTGTRRCQIEGIYVMARARGRGVGKALFEAARAEAERRECQSLQIISNELRVDAHRFYKRLGFTRGHLGFRLELA